MDSMEKMSGPIDRAKEKPLFEKLNESSITLMEAREDIECIIVNYNKILANPIPEIEKLNEFLDGMLNVQSAATAVDPSLHRNVR